MLSPKNVDYRWYVTSHRFSMNMTDIDASSKPACGRIFLAILEECHVRGLSAGAVKRRVGQRAARPGGRNQRADARMPAADCAGLCSGRAAAGVAAARGLAPAGCESATAPVRLPLPAARRRLRAAAALGLDGVRRGHG